MKEQLKTYILCLENGECYAAFAKRLGTTIPKARIIGRKLVKQFNVILHDWELCSRAGQTAYFGHILKSLPNERRLTDDIRSAIAEGVYTLEEFYGIADVEEGETDSAQYVADCVAV